MGHVLTANMTGNIIFLGFAVGGIPGLPIGRSVTALGFGLAGGFFAGKLDSLLAKLQRHLWLAAAFGFEALLLFAAMTVAWRSQGREGHAALYGIIALTAAGMGMRNGTVKRLAVPDLTTTVLTLTVAALAFDFSFTPGSNPRWRRRVGSVFSMFSGAIVGVHLLKYSLVLLLGVSTVLTASCMLAQIFRQETQHEEALRPQQR
jgi:uncharacterized membrane protein YoaK (UPF0700 family)